MLQQIFRLMLELLQRFAQHNANWWFKSPEVFAIICSGNYFVLTVFCTLSDTAVIYSEVICKKTLLLITWIYSHETIYWYWRMYSQDIVDEHETFLQFSTTELNSSTYLSKLYRNECSFDFMEWHINESVSDSFCTAWKRLVILQITNQLQLYRNKSLPT